jgi:hypothetical protein
VSSTKVSAAVTLLLVFASGILVGAVSNRLYMVRTASANAPAPRTMAQYRKQFFEEMRVKVGATDAQIARMDVVLDDAKKKLDALHAEHKPMREKIDHDRIEGIRAVLDDKQRAAYDQWREERAAANQKKSSTK